MYSVHLEEHANRACLEPPMLAGVRRRKNAPLNLPATAEHRRTACVRLAWKLVRSFILAMQSAIFPAHFRISERTRRARAESATNGSGRKRLLLTRLCLPPIVDICVRARVHDLQSFAAIIIPVRWKGPSGVVRSIVTTTSKAFQRGPTRHGAGTRVPRSNAMLCAEQTGLRSDKPRAAINQFKY